MASASTKSKPTKTSYEDTEKSSLLGQEYVPSSSYSSPVEAVSNLFKEEPIVEPSSDSGSGKISPSPSEDVTAAANPETRGKFKQVMEELKRTVVPSGFFPVFKRKPTKPRGRTIPRKAKSEPTPRTTRFVDVVAPLVVSQPYENSSQYLGSDEPVDVEFTSRKNSDEDPPLVSHRTWKERYFDYSIHVVNSYYIVPFLLLLLGLGCFTCYMGFQYFNQCDLLNNSPICFVLMGVSAVAGLLSRIIYVLTKNRWFSKFELCRCGTLAAILIFGMCYGAESMYYIFTKGYPSTEEGPTYCHPFFYNYMFWYNWAVLGVIVILATMHGPNSCHYLG